MDGGKNKNLVQYLILGELSSIVNVDMSEIDVNGRSTNPTFSKTCPRTPPSAVTEKATTAEEEKAVHDSHTCVFSFCADVEFRHSYSFLACLLHAIVSFVI